MGKKILSLGVDIGGTTAKMGLVSETGDVLCRAEESMPHDQTAEVLISRLLAHIRNLLSWGSNNGFTVIGMGISVCGMVTPDGEGPDYINIHALDKYPLRTHFEAEFGIPAILECDMNCGVLGEYYFGARRGVRRLMVTTIGTGIGMGMMVDGQLVRTNVGTTGNPGHIIVDPTGPVCVAGCRGCLESLASAPAISRRAEDAARAQRETCLSKMLQSRGRLTPEDVYLAAEMGDAAAKEIWDFTGVWLGRGLSTWVGIFGPEVIIVGGGVAQAGQWLLQPMEREMYRTGEPYFMRKVKEILQSSLGKELAMLGAASLVYKAKNILE